MKEMESPATYMHAVVFTLAHTWIQAVIAKHTARPMSEVASEEIQGALATIQAGFPAYCEIAIRRGFLPDVEAADRGIAEPARAPVMAMKSGAPREETRPRPMNAVRVIDAAIARFQSPGCSAVSLAEFIADEVAAHGFLSPQALERDSFGTERPA